MPTLKPTPNWTNQELLHELEKRIQAGTIKLEIDQFARQPTEAESNSVTSGLSKNILLLALPALLLLWVCFKQKTTLPVQIQTMVKINEA